ncbi:MAG: hypothetical protein M3Q55_15310 [Acidobacteriota bacterium]|nr:hypothetical protein [Acidobacteriota bacterium]
MKVRVDLSQSAMAVVRAVPASQMRSQFLAGIGAAARQHWIALAQRELRSSSRDYVAGIQEIVVGDRTVEIGLRGMLPNMIENGWPGGDMREWMLQSAKAKSTKAGGKYLVVPFRHGSPTSGGRNVGAAMPQSIHNIAKRLAPTHTAPNGGATQWGDRLSIKKKMNEEARKILSTKKKEWHSASIYMGMVRQEKTYAKATQSQYTTFRTISTRTAKTDPRSWMHPGTQAKHFAPRVQAYTSRIAGAFIERMLTRT